MAAQHDHALAEESLPLIILKSLHGEFASIVYTFDDRGFRAVRRRRGEEYLVLRPWAEIPEFIRDSHVHEGQLFACIVDV